MRRKRVQVGWYCSHEHEGFGEGTHLQERRWHRGKWRDKMPDPNTRQSLSFRDHRDPTQRPNCPLAEPIYVYRMPDGTKD